MRAHQFLGMLVRTANVVEDVLDAYFEGVHDFKCLQEVLLFLGALEDVLELLTQRQVFVHLGKGNLASSDFILVSLDVLLFGFFIVFIELGVGSDLPLDRGDLLVKLVVLSYHVIDEAESGKDLSFPLDEHVDQVIEVVLARSLLDLLESRFILLHLLQRRLQALLLLKTFKLAGGEAVGAMRREQLSV